MNLFPDPFRRPTSKDCSAHVLRTIPQQVDNAKREIFKAAIGNAKAYLVAATLRPETMYGQTNCFVGTGITYGVFTVNDKEVFVCTYRAARNMAFQGITAVRGQINQLTEIEGTLLVGTKINAPFSINPEVYVLPMENVLATKVWAVNRALTSRMSDGDPCIGYWCSNLCPV